jgi:HSP20 family protein
MPSFLEKLRKGMNEQAAGAAPISSAAANPGNVPDDEQNDIAAATFAAYKVGKKTGIPSLDEANKTRAVPQKRMITQISQLDEEPETEEPENADKPAKKTAKKAMPKKTTQPAESDWLNGEGQLVVDMYQTENDLVIQSAIAGIKVEDLDVVIEDDMVTIKGDRANPLQDSGDYFLEECYWGNFSRKIILPVEVDSSRADASMKDGILTIRIPKIVREKKKKVLIKN